MKDIDLYISIFCFSIVWGLNEFLLSLFIIPEQSVLTFIIRFLTGMGLYVFFFRILIQCTNTIHKKFFSEESKVVGEWYQIFEVQNYEEGESKSTFRFGPVSITDGKGVLEITAQNKKKGSVKVSSSWHSNKVNLSENRIWLLYTSTGPDRGSTHGNMLLQFNGKKPQLLSGQFSDSSPARHYGIIDLYKKEADYKDKLNELGIVDSK